MSNIKCLYFDNIYCDVHQRNICNLFIAAYIVTLWRTRKENLRIALVKKAIVDRCFLTMEMIKHSHTHTEEKFFGTYLPKMQPNTLLGI